MATFHAWRWSVCFDLSLRKSLLLHKFILMILREYDHRDAAAGQIFENSPCLAITPKRTSLRIHLAKPEGISREEFLVYLLWVQARTV